MCNQCKRRFSATFQGLRRILKKDYENALMDLRPKLCISVGGEYFVVAE